MADDLDALFGAFDGDSGNDTKEEPAETKKARVQEPLESSDANNQGNHAAPTAPPSDTDSKPSLYTSVMSAPTASHLKESETTETTTPSEEPKIEEPKEIATGISHDKSVRSYSAYPKNLPPGTVYEAVEPPKTPSKEYAFKLDPFQQQAVSYIDKEESVLVAAHTSAGACDL